MISSEQRLRIHKVIREGLEYGPLSLHDRNIVQLLLDADPKGLVQHIKAENDVNGNPQRLYLVMEYGQTWAIKETNAGILGAVPDYRERQQLPDVNVSVAEWKSFLDEFERDEPLRSTVKAKLIGAFPHTWHEIIHEMRWTMDGNWGVVKHGQYIGIEVDGYIHT